MNHDKTAKEILSAVGGNDNINSVIHCVTRLRFNLKDMEAPNKDEIKEIDGVLTVVESGGQFQVVIGNEVPKVYESLVKTMGISPVTSDSDAAQGEKRDCLTALLMSFPVCSCPSLVSCRQQVSSKDYWHCS